MPLDGKIFISIILTSLVILPIIYIILAKKPTISKDQEYFIYQLDENNIKTLKDLIKALNGVGVTAFAIEKNGNYLINKRAQFVLRSKYFIWRKQ